MTVDRDYEEHQNDRVTVRVRERVRGGFGEFIEERVTVRVARDLYLELKGHNYNNTRPGDRVWISVGGTLSQIAAVYQDDWKETKHD
jgi:hypothetical protein